MPAAHVNGVSVCSTRTCTCWHTNFTLRLRSIAPGSMPASRRIWKPLQMPSTGPPAGGERLHFSHDRREARDRAGPQVVAVCEAAGQYHDVGALQVRVLVPDELGVLAEDVCRRVIGVVVAVAAWKHDNGELHHQLDLDAIALDHRIGEQLVGHFRRERRRLGGLRRRKIELEVLSLPDVFDTARSPSNAARRRWSLPCGSNTDGLSVTNTRARMPNLSRKRAETPARKCDRRT